MGRGESVDVFRTIPTFDWLSERRSRVKTLLIGCALVSLLGCAHKVKATYMLPKSCIEDLHFAPGAYCRDLGTGWLKCDGLEVKVGCIGAR